MTDKSMIPWILMGAVAAGTLLSCREQEKSYEREAPAEDTPALTAPASPGESEENAPPSGSETTNGEASDPAPAEEAGQTPPQTELPAGEFPVAKPVPGKPGFIFNPFTNSPVDVQGLPSGTLARDPMDPDQTHKFRVP